MDSWLKSTVLEKGLLTADELARVDAWLPSKGVRLAEKLYRSGLLSDRVLADLFVGKGAKDASDELVDKLPPPAALGAMSRALAEKHRAIGLRVEKGRLLVAMLDPADTDAIEKMSFYVGLAVEPRVARAGVLFSALHRAYGVAEVLPDPSFLAAAAPPGADDETDTLPPPSKSLPPVGVKADRLPTTDPDKSPLARQLVELAGGRVPDGSDDEPGRSLLAVRPARSPKAPPASPPPGTTPKQMRDSLPPQVLPLLVPPFRVAALFLVRDQVAVGWAGRARGTAAGDAVRDVLLPLTGPSAFQRAWGMCSVAQGASEPTTIERMFFRFTKLPPPAAFAVVPILVGEFPAALLYVDTDEDGIDDDELDLARSVGDTLADGLAPLVAAGTVFAK